jgi:hypothetical protein
VSEAHASEGFGSEVEGEAAGSSVSEGGMSEWDLIQLI